jgi:hypothetical protein
MGYGDAQAFQGRGRESPPQPRQEQGIEYFVGTWAFTWRGRESPISPGLRTGTLTFTRRGASQSLDLEVSGTVDDTGAKYRETGTADWDPQTKKLSVREKLTTGAELSGTGDWSSALSIRYESQPTTVGGSAIQVRRIYSILSASSFTVVEEFSVDGGAFERLGQAAFKKLQP